MQNDPWVRETKSAVRCADYLLKVDPKQGYGSRGLQSVPQELYARFDALTQDEQWRKTCRR